MNKTKEIFVTGFALFSMFFGAGNLILPPFLGFKSGSDWYLVTFGFAITAVMIPVLGILAHARLQGTMFDFGKKISPIFSTIYCLIVYTISIALPAPRTASVTHEMAIAPFFGTSSLLTSAVYFTLVFLFVINRSKVLSLIGKFLTPLIIVILLSVIVISFFVSPDSVGVSLFKTPLINGVIEGYQTFDAIGAIVVGGVVIISLNIQGGKSFEEKKELIKKGGWIAGIGLFVIYAGLILSGSLFSDVFPQTSTRSQVLSGLSSETLGSLGAAFLSVLVALACFTTAVGIVTGTADYFKGLFKNSQYAYKITAVLGCVIGVLVGSFNVGFIIDIALPALMFIYPITIVLILLNVIPEQYASKLIFRTVVMITFLFSIPDFLKFIIPAERLKDVINSIPLAKFSLGWVLPALMVFIIMNLIERKSNPSTS